MPSEELKRTLESLHQELSQSGEIDPELRKLLTEVASDIEQALQDEEPGTPESEAQHADLIDRVNNLASHFEAQHPTLAQIIGRIADGLSQLGI
jgi:ribosomal protein S15P/S13E